MPSSPLESVVRNLDQRTTRIEQILPTLATKDDLKVFATKDDLKAFATKEELREAVAELRAEMKAGFDQARRFTLVLHEDLNSQLGLIGGAPCSDVRQRLPRRPAP